MSIPYTYSAENSAFILLHLWRIDHPKLATTISTSHFAATFVDGSEIRLQQSVDMVNILLFTGFYTFIPSTGISLNSLTLNHNASFTGSNLLAFLLTKPLLKKWLHISHACFFVSLVCNTWKNSMKPYETIWNPCISYQKTKSMWNKSVEADVIWHDPKHIQTVG